VPQIAAIAEDCEGFAPIPHSLARVAGAKFAAVRNQWPRRRWRAPGPGTENLGLDASLIVARLPWRRVVPGLFFGAPNRREQAVPLMITRAQRDAIYEIVISHLTAIGDVWLCVERREFAEAKKMGREFAEDLRLLEDLGWSETIDRDTVALTAAADELTQTLARLHRRAARALGVYVSRPKADEELAQRDLAASETLGQILGELARQAGAGEVSR